MIDCPSKTPDRITIVQRQKAPRLILNPDELVQAVSLAYTRLCCSCKLINRFPSYKVELKILEHMSHREQLEQICHSAGYIAVHGSGMGIFLSCVSSQIKQT